MIKLLSGDCRDVLPTLPAESVQCVVCSPPYYGLRDYQTGTWDGGDAGCTHAVPRSLSGSTLMDDGRERIGLSPDHKYATERNPYRDTCGRCGAVRVDRQIGLERSPDEYLATMVGVFREVRRVLRRDGTCWVNMGDSYAGSPAGNKTLSSPFDGGAYRSNISMDTTKHAKPKDLLLMPARLALALQADGWWVRSDIIWHKPNPMPESVTDRPTSAHEHVFLLTKAARYYYDADAVREELQQSSLERGYSPGYLDPGHNSQKMADAPDAVRAKANWRANAYVPSGRNLRNVWTIATHAYPDAHFATFPPELAERCIKAGTSERGCCAACGKPWRRVTQASGGILGKSWGNHEDDLTQGNASAGLAINRRNVEEPYQRTTTGRSPGCQCGADVVPCVVLDPFAGAGTTLLVADRLQRDAIGIELNTAYTEMAMERCRADAPLFTAFPPAEDPEETRMADLFTDMAAD